MITEKNVANLLIVSNGSKTTTHTTNVSAALAGMNTGESVVCTPGGIIVNAASAATLTQQFKIGTKLSTGKFLWSDIIDAKSITKIDARGFTPYTTQVDYVGYNGTSGSIEVMNDNIYTVRMYMLPIDMAGFAQQKIKRGVYKSDSTATQQEIAYGLTENLIQNFSREPEKTKYGTNNIKFERTYSGAVTEGTWTNNWLTWRVIRGSNYITSDEAHGYSTVGNIIILGGVAHVITEITSTTVLKLDLPWQDDTGYVVQDDSFAAQTIAVTNGSTAATLSANAEAPFNVAGTVVYFTVAGMFVKGVMTNTTTGV